MIRDGVRIDAIAIRDGTTVAPPLPTASHGNSWAYATNPNIYQSTTCNGHDYDAAQDATLTTGSLASCYADDSTLPSGTAADHAFDMSGNVKEWTLSHQAGQNPIRGGASNSDDIGTSCGLNFTLANDTFFFPNVGFRCCK
jgi:formylglycine-generating enzyme required for sulfatase activity